MNEKKKGITNYGFTKCRKIVSIISLEFENSYLIGAVQSQDTADMSKIICFCTSFNTLKPPKFRVNLKILVSRRHA